MKSAATRKNSAAQQGKLKTDAKTEKENDLAARMLYERIRAAQAVKESGKTNKSGK